MKFRKAVKIRMDINNFFLVLKTMPLLHQRSALKMLNWIKAFNSIDE
jgi:hypothetical protein